MTIRVGVTTALTTAALYIADKNGYFRSEGLNVQFIEFDSAANMVAPLGAGQLDVGAGVISAGLYNAVSRGIEVRVVADLGSDPVGYGFQQLIIRTDLVKSGRFKAVKDLKGLTLSMPAPGIAIASQLAHLLRTAGLSLSDVKVVYMSNPDAIIALKNGSIDGSLMPEPGPTIAAKNGAAVKIMGDDAYYPNQQIAAILYGTTLLKTHRDAGSRFMRAYIRGVRFYNDSLRNGKITGPHAENILRIFSDASKQSDAAILAAVTPNGNNPNGRPNLTSMLEDLSFFREQGLIQGNISPKDIVDLSFVDDAVKQLGPYHR
ncbi:MAG TPA: ABC transporter substrate-binding protein [Candidatus Binatia bacterium]|nr:ABC transporter substrate-binding protein [Candidatus Binatia bacterium]